MLWAFPFFSWTAMKYHKIAFMKQFYTEDYPQASLGAIALAVVLSVLIDAFTDPKMAVWTDTLKSKWGRRRPFVFVSAFLVPLVFFLAWTPLLPPGIGASIWFGILHLAFKLMDTLFIIPYDAWGCEMTPIYKERTTLWAWREIIGTSGLLLGAAIAPVLFVTDACETTPNSGCIQHPLISLFFGMIFVQGTLCLVWWGKEAGGESANERKELADGKKDAELATKASEDDTVPMLMSTILNPPFRMLLISSMAKACGQEVPIQIIPFVAKWCIGENCLASTELFTFLFACNIIMAVVMVYPWLLLVSKIGKHKGYLGFLIALTITSGSFISIMYDDGTCTATYSVIVLLMLGGASYGGAFLLKDLLVDSMDYDEFLSGGRRREANYIISVEFIPKFMNIPGETIPLLLMAYLKYGRPPLETPACFNFANQTLVQANAFCHTFYTGEPVGANWCSNTKTCAGYVADGISFVCHGASKECGIKQNGNVRWLLIIAFSLVPCFFNFLSAVAMLYYPKAARTEKSHEKLLDAIAKIRRGETVEDPWRPGSFVSPRAPPGPHDGALSYFWPSELRAALKSCGSDARIPQRALLIRPLRIAVFCALVLIPLGVFILIFDIEALGDDLGASVSPMGLMLAGLGILGVWFHGSRAWISRELHDVPREHVISRINQLCPFTGEPRILEGAAASPEPPTQT